MGNKEKFGKSISFPSITRFYRREDIILHKRLFVRPYDHWGDNL